jgi:hypothetical protein
MADHALVSAIIADLMTAQSNCALYSPAHETVLHYTRKAAFSMGEAWDDAGELALTVLGSSLFIGDDKFTGKGAHIAGFLRKLRRKGVEKVIFRDGLDAPELTGFVTGIAMAEGKPASTDHVAVGVVEIKVAGGGGGTDVSALMDEEIAKLKQVHADFARFGRLDMVGVEDIVAGFLTTLKQESNVLKVVSPVKSYSEYTFTHTSNVSVLSIFQAQSLGVKGEALHEVGMAGLLHDFGKMFVPTGILEKPGKLTDEEFEIMRNHTVYGARYLSALDDVPGMAVIAAYEHHMKFNGTGYPDTLRRDRHQHIIAQIISVADFYDALRTDRPYRKALPVPTVIKFMREGYGTDFNPILVDNFVKTLTEIGAFTDAPQG